MSGSDLEEITGTIVGSRGAYLRVRLGNGKQANTVNMHPTWNLKYLPDGLEFQVRSRYDEEEE